MRDLFHRQVLSRVCCSCYPCVRTRLPETHPFGVRFAYQPKAKLKRKAAEVPGYRIGVTKAWDSWHTGKWMYSVHNLLGCSNLHLFFRELGWKFWGFCKIAWRYHDKKIYWRSFLWTFVVRYCDKKTRQSDHYCVLCSGTTRSYKNIFSSWFLWEIVIRKCLVVLWN